VAEINETGPPIAIYVDVDDTFVRSYGLKRIPIPPVVRHIVDLWQQGAELYCWSSGGSQYAEDSANEFGIAHCFRAFLRKPNVMIDDQQISDWRRLIEVHPNSVAEIQEYRTRLEQ